MFCWLVYVSGGVLDNLAVVFPYHYHYDKIRDKVQVLSKNNEPKMLEYSWWTQELISKKRDYNNRFSDWLYKIINDDKAFVGRSSCIYALSGFDFLWSTKTMVCKVYVINQNRIVLYRPFFCIYAYVHICIYTCVNFVMFFLAEKKKET
ncbi:hypothetical protein RFI_39786 [Reticulomyxa filosa]|uniref:Uncharacterized protein n=1 Tax=Reticulomyxa filosa TaxID=46433 RepID=X6L9C9_RETFI|nr:hypothetical protein RFI_39786 [Reticulomyxa filosa]|eukprot:ETN97741.1 hypothetical protein RFI_39786 [Reticulomyxa filosa]